jgi:hypothetical protein
VNVARALLCGVAGHRWTPAEESDASYPVLRCRRCRSERAFTAEDRPIAEQEHRLFWHDKLTPKDRLLDHRLYVERQFRRRRSN